MIRIDIDQWERKQHYLLFKDYLNPYFSICADVDITNFIRYTQKKALPFFASFLFLTMKVLNGIPEFKYRIRENGVVLHETVSPSYTVMTEANLFRFVTTPFIDNLESFVSRVMADIEKHKHAVSLEDIEGVDDLIYVSSLKWISFTMVSHPFDNKRLDSFPRITWGKFYDFAGKTLIPVSVMAHHALCDGDHAGIFYQNLQTEINQLH
jgi:chloramphenicol O-acetyltransferase type A